MPVMPVLERQLSEGDLWPDERAVLEKLLRVLQESLFFMAPLQITPPLPGKVTRLRGNFIASLVTHLTPFFTARSFDSAKYTELHLSDLEIEDDLNLSEYNLPFPLRFIGCICRGKINFSKSYIEEISFQGCDIGVLALNLAEIHRGLHIGGSLIRGRLEISETSIGGSLQVEGIQGQDSSSFTHVTEIEAQELQVRHSVKLTGLQVKGHLNFRFCRIGSDFVVSECVLVSPTPGRAPLNLDNGVIKGDIYLRRSTLLQEGAVCENRESSPALSASHLRAQGNFEIEELSWNSYLELSSIRIGGNLMMRGLSMIAEEQRCKACALQGKGMRIQGQLYIDGQWGNGSGRIWGGLHFPAAMVGMDAHLRRLHIEAPGHKAISLSGALIRGKLQMGEHLKIVGLVRMIALKVQGKFALYQSHLQGTSIERYDSKASSLPPKAIEAQGVSIYGNLELGEKCLIQGSVDLAGLKVNGSLRLKKCMIFPAYTHDNSNEDPSSVVILNLEGGVIQRELDIANESCPETSFSTLPSNANDVEFSLIAGTINLRHLKIGTLRDGVESLEDLSAYPPSAHASGSYSKFVSHLILDGFVYDSIGISAQQVPISLSIRRRINWISHHNHPFSPQPYEHYAQYLAQLGLESSSINVQIRKWDDYLKSYAGKGLSIWRLIQLYILKYVLAYGYKPWRSMYFVIGFILVGTLVFRLGYQAGHITPSSADVLLSSEYRQKNLLPSDYPAFNAFFYSLDTFIPLVSMHIEEYWAPSKDLTLPSLLIRSYFVIHVVAGWFLVTAAIGGFIGILKPPA